MIFWKAQTSEHSSSTAIMWKIVIESSLTQYLHLALLSQKTLDCDEASGGSLWNLMSPFMLALNRHTYIFKTTLVAVSTLWTKAEILVMYVISTWGFKPPDNNLNVNFSACTLRRQGMMQSVSQETEHDDSLTFLDCLKGVVGFNIFYGVGDFLALQNVIVEAEVRDRQLKHLIIPCCVLLKNGTCGQVQIVIWVLVERTKKR